MPANASASRRAPLVVEGEARDVVPQGDAPGRREHADLAHAAAQALPNDARLLDERARPAQQGPTGAPKPFERQNSNGVEAGHHRRRGKAPGRSRFEHAGRVQVDGNAVRLRALQERLLRSIGSTAPPA